MTKETWLSEVVKIFFHKYQLTEVDLGWSDEALEKYFSYSQKPNEFVAWYASKYDLDTLQNYLVP